MHQKIFYVSLSVLIFILISVLVIDKVTDVKQAFSNHGRIYTNDFRDKGGWNHEKQQNKEFKTNYRDTFYNNQHEDIYRKLPIDFRKNRGNPGIENNNRNLPNQVKSENSYKDTYSNIHDKRTVDYTDYQDSNNINDNDLFDKRANFRREYEGTYGLYNQHEPTAEKLYFTCDNISDIDILSYLSQGLNKNVYIGAYKKNGFMTLLVLKSVNIGEDCTEARVMNDTRKYRTRKGCNVISLDRLRYGKDPELIKKLNHPGILKDIGCCEEGHNIIASKQLRAPVCVQHYAESYITYSKKNNTFDTRFKLAMSLMDLLEYLEAFPSGPVRFADLKGANIGIINDELKIIDIETLGDPSGQERFQKSIWQKRGINISNVDSSELTDVPDFCTAYNIRGFYNLILLRMFRKECRHQKSICNVMALKIMQGRWDVSRVRKQLNKLKSAVLKS